MTVLHQKLIKEFTNWRETTLMRHGGFHAKTDVTKPASNDSCVIIVFSLGLVYSIC